MNGFFHQGVPPHVMEQILKQQQAQQQAGAQDQQNGNNLQSKYRFGPKPGNQVMIDGTALVRVIPESEETSKLLEGYVDKVVNGQWQPLNYNPITMEFTNGQATPPDGDG